MTELEAELRAIAEAAEVEYWRNKRAEMSTIIYSAIDASIKLVLEREPSGEMCKAGDDVESRYSTIAAGIYVEKVYRAMTAQLLKELE